MTNLTQIEFFKLNFYSSRVISIIYRSQFIIVNYLNTFFLCLNKYRREPVLRKTIFLVRVNDSLISVRIQNDRAKISIIFMENTTNPYITFFTLNYYFANLLLSTFALFQFRNKLFVSLFIIIVLIII